MPTVNIGESEAGKATEKMSANNSFFITALFIFKRTGLVELFILKSITHAMKVDVIIIDQADPTRPSLGNPNNPRIKPADNTI